MKRALAVLIAVFLLTGCKNGGSVDRALVLREQLLKSNGCSFDALITADYGQYVYTFEMHCAVDRQGDLTFTVTKPETISGITGRITSEGGKLTFDDQVLAFEMLADGQITPVSAPWLLVRSLRSGYIASCGDDDSMTRIGIDDSYREDAIRLDVWLGTDDLPFRGEILWQGRRVVSVEVKNFMYV